MQGFLPGGQVGERAQGEGGGGAGVHSVLRHQAAVAARDGRREDITVLVRFWPDLDQVFVSNYD